jgi:chemotaxis protein MotB
MKSRAGAPLWMITFADMMSLLMCFFVLMLSFAEVDVRKFMQIAGSMNTAFGARIVAEQENPKELGLRTGEGKGQGTSDTFKEMGSLQAKMSPPDQKSDEIEENPEYPEVVEEVQRARRFLSREIEAGKLEIEGGENRLTLRIQERGAFPSGSADVEDKFAPLIERISQLLATTKGTITIAGHTDNRPIKTSRYRSNWELSTARAVTVLHSLLKNPEVDSTRLEVRGYGDSIGLVANDSDENRAINRRVEIIVTRPPRAKKASAAPTDAKQDPPSATTDKSEPAPKSAASGTQSTEISQ